MDYWFTTYRWLLTSRYQMLVQYVKLLATSELNLICTTVSLGTFDTLGMLPDSIDLPLGVGA